MHPLQEKFQITVPAKGDGGEGGWVSQESQRDLGGTAEWCSETAVCVDPNKFNMMPPGMELVNQQTTEQRNQPLVMSGASDVSRDTNPQAFEEGFTVRRMKGSDDQYTGEHVDHFYGDAGGFVERNNYLDRE